MNAAQRARLDQLEAQARTELDALVQAYVAAEDILGAEDAFAAVVVDLVSWHPGRLGVFLAHAVRRLAQEPK